MLVISAFFCQRSAPNSSCDFSFCVALRHGRGQNVRNRRPLLKHLVPQKIEGNVTLHSNTQVAGAQQRKGPCFHFSFSSFFSLGAACWRERHWPRQCQKEFISRRSRPNSENLFFLFSFFIIPLHLTCRSPLLLFTWLHFSFAARRRTSASDGAAHHRRHFFFFFLLF
jgi:hypothetical protein